MQETESIDEYILQHIDAERVGMKKEDCLGRSAMHLGNL